jgi:hypothetical protein
VLLPLFHSSQLGLKRGAAGSIEDILLDHDDVARWGQGGGRNCPHRQQYKETRYGKRESKNYKIETRINQFWTLKRSGQSRPKIHHYFKL